MGKSRLSRERGLFTRQLSRRDYWAGNNLKRASSSLFWRPDWSGFGCARRVLRDCRYHLRESGRIALQSRRNVVVRASVRASHRAVYLSYAATRVIVSTPFWQTQWDSFEARLETDFESIPYVGSSSSSDQTKATPPQSTSPVSPLKSNPQMHPQTNPPQHPHPHS